MTPEQRCVVCGCPTTDHVTLRTIRYTIRAWIKHRVLQRL